MIHHFVSLYWWSLRSSLLPSFFFMSAWRWRMVTGRFGKMHWSGSHLLGWFLVGYGFGNVIVMNKKPEGDRDRSSTNIDTVLLHHPVLFHRDNTQYTSRSLWSRWPAEDDIDPWHIGNRALRKLVVPRSGTVVWPTTMLDEEAYLLITEDKLRELSVENVTEEVVDLGESTNVFDEPFHRKETCAANILTRKVAGVQPHLLVAESRCGDRQKIHSYWLRLALASYLSHSCALGCGWGRHSTWKCCFTGPQTVEGLDRITCYPWGDQHQQVPEMKLLYSHQRSRAKHRQLRRFSDKTVYQWRGSRSSKIVPHRSASEWPAFREITKLTGRR